ncbi:MAG: insulinase family protein [Oligoflexales bacterium]|nr:insulinase family protein [Oligoflexales bacterium]
MRWHYALLVVALLAAGIFFIPGKLSQYIYKERQALIDLNWKHPNDKRQYKALTLPNQLEVLLISDPSLNKSAAAIDVGVGSLEDPKEHLGLAHFLEHMLFLGTEKYPDIEEYSRYLHSYQGSSNAYTAAENTNYHFEVNHDGFEGSLDRFAQFFIAPTFNPEYVERELNAVHSEHQKNLQDDYWRTRMVVRMLHKDGHPRQKFSTGDKHTLGNVTRKVLLDFHKSHYSANQMKLTILSKFSLDKLTDLVEKTFSSVPNYDRKKHKYDSEIFTVDQLPRIISIKPVKDIKKLNLFFPTPSKDPYWKSKPGSTISHLIGHEGEGSLLSKLKKENLATSLSTWLESSSYAGMFQVDMTLTEKGVQEKERIIELFFSYVKMLRKQGLQHYIYEERKTMSDINFVYRDLKEGSYVVAAYASKMHDHPSLEIDRREMLIHEYSKEDFNFFLNTLTPNRLSAVFSTKKAETDQVEKFYRTQYKVEKISQDHINKWQNVIEDPYFKLPEENDFIPKKLEILSSKEKTNPYKLIDNEWGVFWFQQDDYFQLPKANVQLLLYNNKVNTSPQAKIMSLLYTMALSEGLNEWNYDISLAGLNYSVSRSDRGIQLDFSGYAESIPHLMEKLVSKLTKITIDEKRFESLKNDLKRNIANARLDVAYQQLLYEIKFLSSKSLIHRDEIFNPTDDTDLITPISLSALRDYASTLYTDLAIEGSAYGSLRPDDLKKAITSYYTNLKVKPIPVDQRKQVETIRFTPGAPKAKLISSDSHNHCWGSSTQFGVRDPKLNAAIRVGHAHLKTSFFTELRTKQQLGYVVYSGLNHSEKSLGMLFLVQSSEYNPFLISKKVEEWKVGALKELESLSEEKLKAYKQAVATELRESDKTMAEKHQTNIFETIILGGQFQYKEKIATAVENLSKEAVLTAFRKAFSEAEEAYLSVYLYAKKDDIRPQIREDLIKDGKAYKQEAAAY